MRGAFVREASSPRLFPYMTTVSKTPSEASTSSMRITRASRTPRRRQASIVPGDDVDRDDVVSVLLEGEAGAAGRRLRRRGLSRGRSEVPAAAALATSGNGAR